MVAGFLLLLPLALAGRLPDEPERLARLPWSQGAFLVAWAALLVVQGLLLARIDRLPDEVKHTLRVASVIGRQFSVKVLDEVLQGA